MPTAIFLEPSAPGSVPPRVSPVALCGQVLGLPSQGGPSSQAQRGARPSNPSRLLSTFGCCYGMNCIPPNSSLEALTLRAPECDHI